MGKALFLTIIKEDRLDIIVGNRSIYVQSFYRLKGEPWQSSRGKILFRKLKSTNKGDPTFAGITTNSLFRVCRLS